MGARRITLLINICTLFWLVLVTLCIILPNYFRQLYSCKTQTRSVRLQSAPGIMQQTTVILLLIYWPPLLPMIKHYTPSNADNVVVSQLKEKLVSLKKYQYVLLVGPRSNWNKSSLHHVGRRTHRHGFGWRWWVENKAFFERILISNVHSLAAFFYDWTTESLFVCLMKHIEGYVPELNRVCLCVGAHASKRVCLHPFNLHVSVIWVGAHILFGVLGFHWQQYEAVAGDTDERNPSALFSLLSKIVVLGRQPLPIIAETGSGICLSCLWFTTVSVP